ncbi:phage tail protein [Deinococcus ficus]|uniref:Phage tail protein n=1 Tax=Deinococcus ficus TaxID=317577 RepID=A0A221T2H8_9DEIO|nr:tail fiber protein [Deinococcus ficus]ASN83104.1 phage tail protein [Deinococcus ficus]
MSEPFLAEIRLTSFNFAPKGWAMCNGQLLPINQNQALFSLLGTAYGGNGQTNFALPDLRGRRPMHASGPYPGQMAGQELHTLNTNEVPAHNHALNASSSPGSAIGPAGNVLAATGEVALYTDGAGSVALNSSSIQAVGGGQPHENRPPYLVLNYIIALQGIFPSRN